MRVRSFIIISCVLALALTVPVAAFAGNGSAGAQGPAAGESVKGADASESAHEPLQEQTRAQVQTQEQQQDECAEGCDEQPQTRVRSERRVGNYPDEPTGDGDRDRVRDRSCEESETADTTETVDPPTDPDDGSDDSTQTIEIPEGDASAGLLAGIANFFAGIMRSLGLS